MDCGELMAAEPVRLSKRETVTAWISAFVRWIVPGAGVDAELGSGLLAVASVRNG